MLVYISIQVLGKYLRKITGILYSYIKRVVRW